ncbi:MAG: nitroreductase family deazaflavin-dependent oxidoreductase [bacterium]
MAPRPLPAVRKTWLVTVMWRLHRAAYRLSGGRLGGRLLGIPVLLLTTTGRRSGKPQTRALTYFAEGKTFIVIASNGGEPAHPAWFLNLRAHPDVKVQIGRRLIGVRGREVQDAERERLWAWITSRQPSYARYQARTSRRIPVVILEPDS